MDFKKLTPHLIAFGLFVAISFAYCLPVLEGKKIDMHDMNMYAGMAHESVAFRDSTGIDPLWTNSMFGGMPTYQISAASKSDFMSTLFSVLRSVFPEPVYILVLALFSFYILLLALKVNQQLSVVGAIGFAFASYLFIILNAGHITKAMAIATGPLLVAGVINLFHQQFIKGAFLTLLGAWLQLYCNHYQMTYYLGLILVVIGIAYFVAAILSKRLVHYLKAVGVIVLAGGLSLLPTYLQLFSTLDYAKFTTRGASELTEKKVSDGLDIDYAFAWSYGVGETFTLLIPDFYGGASQGEVSKSSATYKALQSNGAGAQASSFIKQVPLYWGDQSITGGPTYIGAINIFLFVLALLVLRGALKWGVLASVVLVMMLSWGKNFESFNNFMFYNFPAYSKFRAVSMILSFTSLLIPLLGFVGLSQLIATKDKSNLINQLLKAAGFTAGFCLLCAIGSDMFSYTGAVDEQLKSYPQWLLDAIREDRQSALQSDAFRSFALITLAAAAIWFYLKGRLNQLYMVVAIGGLMTLDLWTVGKRYLNNDNFVSSSKLKSQFSPSQADATILQDQTLGYRVMNTSVSTFNDASTSYFHRSIGGYHGTKLKRYQEVIEYQIAKNNMNVLNMLNTKYFIMPDEQSGGPVARINPGALGAAWLVNSYQLVANADSEMSALSTFNPKQTAIIDQRFKVQLGSFSSSFEVDSTASINLQQYAPNELKYDFNATMPQLAVFSEIYYEEGWNAYIDGKAAPYFRCNYILRGMALPAGKHQIIFKFEPANYYKAEKIAYAGSIAVSVILLVLGGLLLRKTSEK